jgi:serine/threonine protein kinase
MTEKAKPDRWILIEEIFQNAVERPESERIEYIRQACGDDKELRTEVESLLASDREGTTVQSLIAEDVRELDQAPVPSEAGMQVGSYRLLREIDSGGMGAVYLGVRSDDQYFQIVAVKMIRKGLECPALIQRFRAERQILATLQHPNIGAILDGGELPDGRPYIVMEYVEGQPITLAGESISIRQRIELFCSVCSAVHYAHQKLVIHRDVKPSNVLVTSENLVKLIDFGISKPLAPELIHENLPRTETAQRMMTPDYASPEQFLGQAVTAASDIYSLGVLLFELLTGSRPYNLRELTPASAEKVICSDEPRKPSQVEGLSPKTKKELAGDLDRIVLMAMDCDPLRRYQSAHHLEEDLDRYLEGKPIAARKATLGYQMKKFVQRNKTAVLVTCALSALLCVSVLFYSWQSRRAEGRVKQIESLANSTISDITDKLQQSSASVETQAALFHSALQYLDKLRQSSENDPHVLLELAKAYGKVGDLEGSPFVANLGNSGTALRSYQEALALATEAHSRLPGEESTKTLIEACQRLALMEYSFVSLEHLREASDHLHQCLPLARDFWQQQPADSVRKSLLAYNYSGLSVIEEVNREPDKALNDVRNALQILGPEVNGDDKHDMRLSTLYNIIGTQFTHLGAHAEALENLRKSVTIAEAVAQRSPPPNQAKRRQEVAYSAMSAFLVEDEMLNLGDTNLGQAYARKTLTLAEEMVANDSKNADARVTLGYAYLGMGNAFRLAQPAAAADWYRKSIVYARQMNPPSESEFHVASREEALAAVLTARDQSAERLELLQDANARRLKLATYAPDLPLHREYTMRSYCRLSDAELAANNLAKARNYADLAAPFLHTFPLSSPDLRILRDVGLCYEDLGNVQRQIAMSHSISASERQTALAEARQWYAKSDKVWAEWNRRGAATPESEQERRKVERLLGNPKGHA